MDNSRSESDKKVIRHVRYIPKGYSNGKFYGVVHETKLVDGKFIEEERELLHSGIPAAFAGEYDMGRQMADRYEFPPNAPGETEERFRPCHDGVSYIEYDDGTKLVVSIHGCHTEDFKGNSLMRVVSEPYTTPAVEIA